MIILLEYFAKLNPLGGSVKVELDLSNYATKAGLRLFKV